MEASLARRMFKNPYYRTYLAALAAIGVVGAKAILDLPGEQPAPAAHPHEGRRKPAPAAAPSARIVVPPAHRFLENPLCPGGKPEHCAFSQKPRLWGHTVWTTPLPAPADIPVEAGPPPPAPQDLDR